LTVPIRVEVPAAKIMADVNETAAIVRFTRNPGEECGLKCSGPGLPAEAVGQTNAGIRRYAYANHFLYV
jgi:hypothetical protein